MICSCVPVHSSAQIQSYYVNDTDKVKDDYYVNDKNADVWQGKLKELYQLKDEITKADFDKITSNNINNVLEKGNKSATAAFDLTFSLEKSFSLAMSVEDEKTSSELNQLFRDSVKETLNEEIEKYYIAKNISIERLRNGVKRELTQNALFSLHEHELSREQDLEKHIHVLVHNTTIDSSGNQCTIDGLHLMRNQKLFGALARNRFYEKVLEKGYQLEETKNGYKLAGYDDKLLEEFSKRRQQIEKYIEENALEKTAKIYQKATLMTRKTKDKNADLKNIKDEAREICKQYDAKVIKNTESNFKKLTELEKNDLLKNALLEIQDKKFAFTESELRLAILNQNQLAGLKLSDVETLIKNSNELKFLGQRTDIKIENQKSQEITTNFFTTKSNLRLKQNLYNAAKNCKGKGQKFSSKEIELAMQKVHERTGATLKDEQANFVKNFLASSDQAYILNGKPGTGKTFSMLYLRNTLKELGYDDSQISGACFQKAAALELTKDTIDATIEGDQGIKSTTLDSLLIKKEIESLKNQGISQKDFPDFANHSRKYNFKGLDKITKPAVLIIDEAGMVDDVKLKAVMDYSKAVSTKECPLTVLFSGDYNQIASIGIGGFYRTAADNSKGTAALAGSYLNDISRQKEKELKAVVESICNDESVSKSFALLHKRSIKDIETQIKNADVRKGIVVHTNNEEIAQKAIDQIRLQMYKEKLLRNEYIFDLPDKKNSVKSISLGEGDRITLTRSLKNANKGQVLIIDKINNDDITAHTLDNTKVEFDMSKMRAASINYAYVSTSTAEAERLAKQQNIDVVEAHGGIIEAKTDVEKEAIAVKEYFQVIDSKRSVAICVETNDQRKRINEKVREKMLERGEIDKKEYEFKVNNGQQQRKNGKINKNYVEEKIKISKGDQLICLKNDNRTIEKGGTGTYNNMQCIVKNVDSAGNLELEADNKVLKININEVKSWTHAYAKTVNKLQGATLDENICIENSANRNSHFVAVSRARYNALVITSNQKKLENAANKWVEQIEESSFAPESNRPEYRSLSERAEIYRENHQLSQDAINEIRAQELNLEHNRTLDDIKSLEDDISSHISNYENEKAEIENYVKNADANTLINHINDNDIDKNTMKICKDEIAVRDPADIAADIYPDKTAFTVKLFKDLSENQQKEVLSDISNLNLDKNQLNDFINNARFAEDAQKNLHLVPDFVEKNKKVGLNLESNKAYSFKDCKSFDKNLRDLLSVEKNYTKANAYLNQLLSIKTAKTCAAKGIQGIEAVKNIATSTLQGGMHLITDRGKDQVKNGLEGIVKTPLKTPLKIAENIIQNPLTGILKAPLNIAGAVKDLANDVLKIGIGSVKMAADNDLIKNGGGSSGKVDLGREKLVKESWNMMSNSQKSIEKAKSIDRLI